MSYGLKQLHPTSWIGLVEEFTPWPRHKGRGASIMLAVFFFFFPFNPSKYQIQAMVPSTVKKVSFLYAIPFWKVLLHILRHASVYLNCKFSQLKRLNITGSIHLSLQSLFSSQISHFLHSSFHGEMLSELDLMNLASCLYFTRISHTCDSIYFSQADLSTDRIIYRLNYPTLTR